jgi:hypothetical protein
MPVADDHEGPFLPPVTAKTMHVSDSRQAEAAQRMFQERDAALAAQGEAPVDDKPAATPEARQARKHAERTHARATEVEVDSPGAAPGFALSTGDAEE